MATQKFIQFVQSGFKFNFFLFSKLPSAYFSGVRVNYIDENKAEVTVKYKWFSQNPFKSTYFACLAMAAELSTGLLAMMNVHEKIPKVSMLVVSLEANYFKKAIGTTSFICEDGEAVSKLIELAINTGEAQIIKCKSVGKNAEGAIVAEFFITWSFKTKRKI